MQKIISFFLILSTISYTLTAQEKPTIQWDEHFGYFWNDSAKDIIQNIDGGITFTGMVNPPRKMGKDIFLVTINKDKSIQFNRTIGDRGDDEGNAVIQTFDGGYLIAGYTASSNLKGYQGRKDAWLVKTNEDGFAIWDKLFGSRADDQFFDVVQDEMGNLIMAGKKDRHFWLVKTNFRGEKIWEKTFPQKGNSEARGLTLTPSGDILAVGKSEKDKKEALILLKVSADGQKKWDKQIPEAQGFSITKDLKGDFIVVGITAKDFRNRKDFLITKWSDSGEILWQQTKGGLEDDAANAVAIDFENNVLVTGFGTDARGARRNKLWVVKYNSEGQLQWESAFGKRSEDQGQAIMVTHSGEIVAAGFSASGKLQPDAWVIELGSSYSLPKGSARALQFTKPKLIDDNGNGVIEADERAYLSFNVTNNGTQPTIHLMATVKINGIRPKGLTFFPKIEIGHLAVGEQKKITIPIAGSNDLRNGEANFQINLTDNANTSIPPINFSVNCNKAPEPVLVLESPKFLSDGVPLKIGQRNKNLLFNIQLKNKGNLTATNVRVKFSFARHVNQLSDKLLILDDLKPGESKNISFQFEAESVYRGEEIAIGCRVMEATTKYGLEDKYFIALEEVAPEPVAITEAQFTNIDWTYPDLSKTSKLDFVSKEDTYDIKLFAISSKRLIENDFTIFVNDKPYAKGEKFDRVQLSAFKKEEDGSSKQFTYTLEASIDLTEGNNKIQAKVKNDAGADESATINVEYQPTKPNLHILTIGVPYVDLEFPQKDATDFLQLFNDQKGKLYGNIYTSMLTTKDQTTTTNLKTSLLDLQLDYLARGKIQEKDVLIVFISSHGDNFDTQDTFRIIASDYKRMYPFLTTIDYKEDIVNVLAPIDCKKYLFIDACQSGAIKFIDAGRKGAAPQMEDMSNALNRLALAQSGLRTLVSCSPGEFSYEDKEWRNGAFTKGIIEAFNDIEVKTDDRKFKANANDDAVVTLDELYQFLQVRVPFLVQKRKGDNRHQKPFMPEKHQGEELPIYYLGKE